MDQFSILSFIGLLSNIFEKKDDNTLNDSASLKAYCSRCISLVSHFSLLSQKSMSAKVNFL